MPRAGVSLWEKGRLKTRFCMGAKPRPVARTREPSGEAEPPMPSHRGAAAPDAPGAGPTRRVEQDGEFRAAAPDAHARFAIDEEVGSDGLYVWDETGERKGSPEKRGGSYSAGKSRGSKRGGSLAIARWALFGFLGLLLVLAVIVGWVNVYVTPSNYDVELGRERLEKGFEVREACKADTTPRKHAIVTLLTTPGTYPFTEFLNAAKVLGKSLVMHGRIACSVDMVVMVPEALAEDQTVAELLKFGWSSIHPAPAVHVPSQILEQIQDHKFRTMFAKLNLFNWTMFETILYMDSDTLVLGDLMPLFDKYAAEMGRAGKALGWVHDQPYSVMPHGHNAGIMLLRPSMAIFKRLIGVSISGDFDKEYAEQGVLNEVFKGPETYLELPQDYNLNVVVDKWNASARGDVEEMIKVIHYTTVKPFDPFYSPWNCFILYAYIDCKEWFLINAVD